MRANVITGLTSSHTGSVLRCNSTSSFAEGRELDSFGGRNILILLVEALLGVTRRGLNPDIISCIRIERHDTINSQSCLVTFVG